jgi:tape measure domain-containing protein
VFDNAKFEAGVAKTIATLGKLDASLKDIGKKGSWADIENAANRVTFSKPTAALGHFRDALGGMGSKAGSVFSGISQAAAKVAMSGPTKELDKLQSRFGLGITPSARKAFTNLEKESHQVKLQGVTDAINEVSHKFSILRGAASVALGGIAQRAASAGANVIKSLTLTPVMEGFHNYETQINAVQTILANTGLKGKAGLGQVTGALNNLNTYANKTVYNFSEMARNIGTFTAAGVKLGPAVNSIKGIANLAAMSGSTSQQASGAMYQLSQAIAAGQVHLQDWNSVVNAGMGGKVFQNALMQTGLAMGTISKSAYSVDKATGQATISGNSFRQSIQSKPGETSAGAKRSSMPSSKVSRIWACCSSRWYRASTTSSRLLLGTASCGLRRDLRISCGS